MVAGRPRRRRHHDSHRDRHSRRSATRHLSAGARGRGTSSNALQSRAGNHFDQNESGQAGAQRRRAGNDRIDRASQLAGSGSVTPDFATRRSGAAEDRRPPDETSRRATGQPELTATGSGKAKSRSLPADVARRSRQSDRLRNCTGRGSRGRSGGLAIKERAHDGQ